MRASGWVGFCTPRCRALPPCASAAETLAKPQPIGSARRRCARRLNEMAGMAAGISRAFYDDGTPLGSAQDAECQIDGIAQAWAVLSGAGEPDRAAQAMDAVRRRLMRPEDGLLLLFTPPFDKTPRDPGYIKGYLPGTRENGGQYTHAALWSAWAFAELDQSETAEGILPAAQSHLPRRHPYQSRAVQGRAIRRRRRCLWRGAPHRTGRLDLVHRLGGLDVPAGAGRHSGSTARGRRFDH